MLCNDLYILISQKIWEMTHICLQQADMDTKATAALDFARKIVHQRGASWKWLVSVTGNSIDANSKREMEMERAGIIV